MGKAGEKTTIFFLPGFFRETKKQFFASGLSFFYGFRQTNPKKKKKKKNKKKKKPQKGKKK